MSEEIVAVSNADVVSDLRTYDVKDLREDSLSAYCSVKGDSIEQKALVFNAANNPQHKVSDFINKKVLVKDVFVESIEIADKVTGELTQAPRVVLIDESGEAYECVSVGMFTALQRLIATFGEPTWEEAIPVVIKNVPVKNGSMLTLVVEL